MGVLAVQGMGWGVAYQAGVYVGIRGRIYCVECRCLVFVYAVRELEVGLRQLFLFFTDMSLFLS